MNSSSKPNLSVRETTRANLIKYTNRYKSKGVKLKKLANPP